MAFFKIFRFLNSAEKKRWLYTNAVSILSSLAETFFLFLLVPYISIVAGSDKAISSVNFFFGLQLDRDSLVLAFSLSLALSVVIKSFLQIYANYLTTAFPYRFYHEKTLGLFEHYLKQDYQSFVNRKTSTLLKHCTQTSFYATQAISQQLQLIAHFFVAFCLFTLLLMHDFLGSLIIMSIFGSIGFGVFIFHKKPVKAMGKELAEQTKSSYQIALESLEAFKEVRIYGKTAEFIKKFDRSLFSMAENYRKTNFYSLLPSTITETAAILMIVGVVLFLYAKGGINSQFVAALILYAAVARRALPAINQIAQLSITLQHTVESLLVFQKELANFSQEPPPLSCRRLVLRQPLNEVLCGAKAPGFVHRKWSCIDLILPHLRCTNPGGFRASTAPHLKLDRALEQNIRFEQVSFSYEKNRDVLKEISFEIPKNSSAAFVGPSGGGKSTIVNLLIGLIRPTGGKIILDGEEMETLAPLQHKIGYVPQGIVLLHDSIAANIAFGEEKVDQKRVEKCLEASHLKDFAASLPNGVETIVGDRGIKISGGQIQRIGIARALYQNPDLVIFDEATASLDKLSEMIIAQSLKEMMGAKTLVAIAHNLSTVKHFDKIYVLDQGKITASGSHAELLRSSEMYRSLYFAHKEEALI